MCLIPVGRSVPCEDPKLEADDDHSLLVNAVGWFGPKYVYKQRRGKMWPNQKKSRSVLDNEERRKTTGVWRESRSDTFYASA